MDQNDLEALPESIVQCRSLEQLDVSENKLMVLPDEIGDLERLADLTVAQNCLQVLPSSIGSFCLFSRLYNFLNIILRYSCSEA